MGLQGLRLLGPAVVLWLARLQGVGVLEVLVLGPAVVSRPARLQGAVVQEAVVLGVAVLGVLVLGVAVWWPALVLGPVLASWPAGLQGVLVLGLGASVSTLPPHPTHRLCPHTRNGGAFLRGECGCLLTC